MKIKFLSILYAVNAVFAVINVIDEKWAILVMNIIALILISFMVRDV